MVDISGKNLSSQLRADVRSCTSIHAAPGTGGMLGAGKESRWSIQVIQEKIGSGLL